MKLTTIKRHHFCAFVFCVTLNAFALDTSTTTPSQPKLAITQEAVAACNRLEEKDGCQFNQKNTITTGTCRTTADQDGNYVLACKPDPVSKPIPDDDATPQKEHSGKRHSRNYNAQ